MLLVDSIVVRGLKSLKLRAIMFAEILSDSHCIIPMHLLAFQSHLVSSYGRMLQR